jgi:hypothetical protein
VFDASRRPANTGEHFLIYANSHCVAFREEAFRRLSRIGAVHYGGACSGGLAGGGRAVLSEEVRGNWQWQKNPGLFRRYRFALAMEIQAADGYITEKILMAFLSGSVPIYYGTTEVFELFNPRAFVFYDIHSPQAALDRVAYLEGNRTAYLEVLREPVLAHGEETIAEYFSLRDGEGGGRLRRAIRERIGYGVAGPP